MRKKSTESKRRGSSKPAGKSPPLNQRPSLMERTRAARVMVDALRSEAAETAAFMALFHPDYDEGKTRELVNDARRRQRGV